MRRNRYPEWDDQIINLYVEKEWTMKQIGDHIGWSKKFVRNRLLHHNIPLRKSGDYPRTRPETNRNIQRAVLLYRDVKLTVDETAEVMGCSRAAVLRYLECAGVKRRPRGEPGKKFYAKIRAETR